MYIGIPCAVFFLTMITIFWIRERRSKMREATLNIPQSLNPITERPYDYIDESVLEAICHKDEVSTTYKEVTSFIQSEESSEKSSVNSFATEHQSSVCRDGYLKPYCSLQTELKPVPYDVHSETST